LYMLRKLAEVRSYLVISRIFCVIATLIYTRLAALLQIKLVLHVAICRPITLFIALSILLTLALLRVRGFSKL
jgi:hypothetical protein